MHGILERLTSIQDLKTLAEPQVSELCAEIRDTLVSYGKTHGGHIGSNLGVVELTVALHRVFDSPRDRIIFDVSHQAYVHKMLTGRARPYRDPSHADDITGFTNPAESEHDHFVLGHTGTSISLACGIAKARDMAAHHDNDDVNACRTTSNGQPGPAQPIGNVIAVIGDGALSSAVAFEGLNNAAAQGGNLIIIVNDNEMSIADNVGGMYDTLAQLRKSQGTYQPNLFEAFGLQYRYVEHGNDEAALEQALREVRDIDHPIVLHIHTCKGLGLDEEDAQAGLLPGSCEANHWQNPLHDANKLPGARKHYGEQAMTLLRERWREIPGLVVISPATPGSNGITQAFRATAGEHYVDTGITEEHAAAYAAGIAAAGGTPVLATSATFFQRAYDQIQQELSLNGAPVTLLVFGAGLSNADNTHSGAFDITMFANIPGIQCLAPTSGEQFLAMLDWSVSNRDHGTVVIRVPGDNILAEERRNGLSDERTCACDKTQDYAHATVLHHGSQVALIALGNCQPLAARTARALREHHIDATIVDPHRYDTLDTTMLCGLADNHRLVVTVEDGQQDGGWGTTITAWYANHTDPRMRAMHVLNAAGAKEFTDRVPLRELCERYGLTEHALTARILDALEH